MFMVLSSWHSGHCKSSPVHAVTVEEHQAAASPQSNLTDLDFEPS